MVKSRKVKYMSVLDTKENYALAQKNLHVSDVGNYTNNIIGEVLAIIDASISDKEQRRAIKQLIKRSVWDTNGRFWESVLTKREGTTIPITTPIYVMYSDEPTPPPSQKEEETGLVA